MALGIPVRPPIEQGLRFYSAATEPTFSESVVQWQLSRQQQDAEVVVIGDSSALTALIPSAIARRSGHTVENLATVAPLHITGHVHVLERYLESHPPPKWVVYHFADESLSVPDAHVESKGLRPALRWWLGHRDTLVSRWPTTRLRAAARALIGGHRYPTWANDDGIRSFLSEHAGFLRDETTGAERQTLLDTPRARVPIDPDALPGLGRLIEGTAQSGTRLLLVRAPIPDTDLNPQTAAAHAGNEALLDRVAARFPHIRLAKPYVRTLPVARFARPEHPDLEGASKNSAFVAEQLRE